MQRALFPAIVAMPILLVLALSPSPAGSDKGGPWQPFLPADAYKVLTERSIKMIEDTAKASDISAAEKLDIEAAILAGYTLSIKDPNDESASRLRGAALQVFAAATSGKLKTLGGFGKSIPQAPKAPAEMKAWMNRKESFLEMMELYRNKAKRGEGIHPDLQYQPKLKNQNGIEALLGALATKKLSDENLTKVARELPLLSYRIAVTANLTQYAAPAKGKDRWHSLAVEMRAQAVALAKSAEGKNAEGIMKAADALQNSCTNCHREFKAK